MRDEIGKRKLHVLARFRLAEQFAVDVRGQRQMHFGVFPRLAEFVRRDEHRRQRRARLRLQEAEALGQFRRNQIAQTHVVDQADQLNVLGRLRARRRHRHVIGDDDDLGFQIDAIVLARHAHRIARTIETGADRLIHQRVDVETLGHFGAARAAHALDVRKICAAVDELVRARQRRGKRGGVEREHGLTVDRLRTRGVVEQFVDAMQTRRGVVPIFERALQRVRDVGRAHGAREIAADDDQRAVAAAFLQACEFHRWISLGYFCGGRKCFFSPCQH